MQSTLAASAASAERAGALSFQLPPTHRLECTSPLAPSRLRCDRKRQGSGALQNAAAVPGPNACAQRKEAQVELGLPFGPPCSRRDLDLSNPGGRTPPSTSSETPEATTNNRPRFSLAPSQGERGGVRGWFLIVLALLLAAVLPLRAAEPDILTVAIFDFESRDENVRDLGQKVSSLLNATLSAEPQIITVERAELEKVLGEQELGLSGTVSPDTAAKVGHLTGAKVLVTGRVFKADKELILVAKIIGTETSRVYGELVKGGLATPITDLSSDLARKIAATVSQKGETLMAKVESRDDRLARIKKSLTTDHLPTVSVHIGERHFGQPVIDPAAETELGLILQQCGFKLLDDKSKDRPDIEITGDAFSAYGLRKGNLVSCKARVEIKAQKPGGQIVAMDRQTSVAVDVAEQTAAKTALQNAAMELAERLIPKLNK